MKESVVRGTRVSGMKASNFQCGARSDTGPEIGLVNAVKGVEEIK